MDSEQPHTRLRAARRAAGYSSAAEAARALTMTSSTYAAYENGQNGYTKLASRFARKFNVSVDWLLTGRGTMSRATPAPTIRMAGVVAGGQIAADITDAATDALPQHVTLPLENEMAALVVKGTSMQPRFMDGDVILYDPTPRPAYTMVDRYVIAQTEDGRLLIKKLHRSKKPDHWTLWSHNDREEETRLLTTHRVYGVLL